MYPRVGYALIYHHEFVIPFELPQAKPRDNFSYVKTNLLEISYKY